MPKPVKYGVRSLRDNAQYNQAIQQYESGQGGTGGIFQGIDMNQFFEGNTGSVDMPSSVRGAVYHQVDVGLDDIAEASIDASASSDFEQSYIFRLQDGRIGRATYRAGEVYIQMNDGSINNPPPFQLRTFQSGNMTATYRPNRLDLNRSGETSSTVMLHWQQIAQQLDPRLTPDNIHRVAQASDIQGTSLLQELRNWKNAYNDNNTPQMETAQELIKNILDNHDLPPLPLGTQAGGFGRYPAGAGGATTIGAEIQRVSERMASEYDNSQLQDVINAYADENTEPRQTHPCLLYTSPSPRDS